MPVQSKSAHPSKLADMQVHMPAAWHVPDSKLFTQPSCLSLRLTARAYLKQTTSKLHSFSCSQQGSVCNIT